MTLFSISLTLFLIMNSIGHINDFLELIGHLNPNKWRRILIREMIIALILMIAFHYFGEILLRALNVQPFTVRIAGGVIMFLIAIRMIFPKSSPVANSLKLDEPFIVPLATPMIAGPSILASVMLYAHSEKTLYKVPLAIIIAWAFTVIILSFAPIIKRHLGNKALTAINRLMGLILTLMAVEMLLKGIQIFVMTQFGP